MNRTWGRKKALWQIQSVQQEALPPGPYNRAESMVSDVAVMLRHTMLSSWGAPKGESQLRPEGSEVFYHKATPSAE